MSEYKKVEAGVTPNLVVDLKGLNCPLPLLRVKKEISKMNSEQILQSDCTDIGCHNDFSGWCSRMGHKYLGSKNNSNFTSYYIQKK